MRMSISGTAGAGGAPSKVILLSSVAFLLAAAMQLATAWIQTKNRNLQCADAGIQKKAVVVPSPNFEEEYTWLGDDYPNYLPLELGEPVAMTIEDSRYYQLDSEDAGWEWHSIYPGGELGFIRLGPNKRFFSLSLYHQIHCLEALRKAIVAPQNAAHQHTKKDSAHSSHCLNYLRQTLMCAADLTLEPEIEVGSMNVGEGLGVTHVCKDWSKVHAFVAKNWEDWDSSQRGNRTQ